MAVYAIGDVQGCDEELARLLDAVRFDPACDRLWFAGDLVNRGPRSLATLRRVRGLGESALCVLGNHDLHLLAVASGHRALHRKDTFASVLDAPDAAELIAWLRQLPMLHYEDGFLLVHAGLPPQWDLSTATACARELEETLRGPRWPEFAARMYGNEPERWDPQLSGWDRLRFSVNCLTRMRYCAPDGSLVLNEKGPPGTQATGLLPWYEMPGRRSRGQRVLFGHWATLSLSPEQCQGYGVFHLDSGCVWGGALSALRLEDLRWFSVSCAGHARRAR